MKRPIYTPSLNLKKVTQRLTKEHKMLTEAWGNDSAYFFTRNREFTRGIGNHSTTLKVPQSIPFIILPYYNGTNLEKYLSEQIRHRRVHTTRTPAKKQQDKITGLQMSFAITKVMTHLHNQGIIHCDFKPDNCLVTLPISDNAPCFPVMPIDLGYSLKSSPLEPHSEQSLNGTPGYIAPELLQAGSLPYSTTSDCYAVGLTLIQILDALQFFKHSLHFLEIGQSASLSYDTVYKHARGIQDTLHKEAKHHTNDPTAHRLCELLGRTVAIDPAERPPLEELSDCLQTLLREQGHEMHGNWAPPPAPAHFPRHYSESVATAVASPTPTP